MGSQLWGILHGAPCSPAGSLCRDHWRAAEKAKEEGQRRERRERSRIFRLTAWQPAMTRVSVFQTQSLNAEFSPVMIVYSSRSNFMIHNENKPKELRKKNGLPCPSQIFWKYSAEHKHDTPRSYLDPFSTEAASTRWRTCGASLTTGGLTPNFMSIKKNGEWGEWWKPIQIEGFIPQVFRHQLYWSFQNSLPMSTVPNAFCRCKESMFNFYKRP